jgi:hypothetical protein
VEHERFDDVAFRIVEEPEPPRRSPRRRRWLLTLTACALTTGVLAAGASALVGGGEEPRVKSGETSTKGWWKTDADGWTRYAPLSKDGRGCDKARGERRSRVRY